MSKKCTDCDEALPKNGNFITCSCNCKWHYSCSGLTQETWKAKSNKKKVEWKCKKCRVKDKETTGSVHDSDSDDSQAEPDSEDKTKKKVGNNTDQKQGKRVDNQDTRITELEKKIREVITSLEFVMEENAEIKKENECLRHEIREVRDELKECQKREVQIKKVVEDTNSKIMRQSQEDRMKNIEICGIEQKEGENLKEVAAKISKLIRVEEETLQEIAKIYRVPTTKSNLKNNVNQNINVRPNNIIVEFKNKQARDTWIQKGKMRVNNKDVVENGMDYKIFVNEHLTFEYKRLLMQAKTRAKDNSWKFTWIKEGKILCRKKEGEKVIIIEKEDDLNKIK